MKHIRIVLLGVLLAAGFTGCETDRVAGPARKPCPLDELRCGDWVTVAFADIPPQALPPEQRLRIKDDGTLTLPQGVSVVAAAKTISLVEKEIVALYVPKYYTKLTVALKTDDRWYSVGGEVKNPSRQVYAGPTTLLRAIQSCGDFTDFAKKTEVQITHADGTKEIVDCKKARKNPQKYDVPICPGDSVHVPQARW